MTRLVDPIGGGRRRLSAAPRRRARRRGAAAPGRRAALRRARGGRGSMSVEMVLLAPVFLLFLLFIVGAARIVEANGEVNGAARDAARAASIQRDFGAAQDAARQAAEAALEGSCKGAPDVQVEGDWTPGGSVSVQVACEVDLSAVTGVGFGSSLRITATAVAHLDRFRRIEQS